MTKPLAHGPCLLIFLVYCMVKGSQSDVKPTIKGGCINILAGWANLENKIRIYLYLRKSNAICLVQNLMQGNKTTLKESIYKVDPVNYTLADAVKTDVVFRIFTDEAHGVYSDEERIKNLEINSNRSMKIFIHGYMSSENSYFYRPLKDEYFRKGKYTIIFVDWSKAAGKPYRISSANTKPIGNFIGDFVIASGVELRLVHVIGHSLGAHVAGFVGKHIYARTGNKIGRVTATDPAGPSFESGCVQEDGRLAKSDGLFVDVIHSDIGHYGFGPPIGVVDFYPNGGIFQPGCPSYEEDDNASHARSNWYFIESVNSTDFKAKKCSSWDDFQRGKCDSNETIVFGDNVSVQAEGIYYFVTNHVAPFAKG